MLGRFLLQCRVELVQEAHVVLEVEAQVLHAVLQHGDTLNTHTEGEARVLLRVDTTCLQYVRVNHTATHNLQPACTLTYVTALAAAEVTAHVHLSRWLGEWEVRWTHTDCSTLAEHLLCEVENRLLHIGKRYVLVDVQALDLVEDSVCTIRDGLVTEHTTWTHDADRWLLVVHSTHLN